MTSNTDLERAIAVIADLCGAGRPPVKESKEQLEEWAEEFTDRYFNGSKSPRLAGGPIESDPERAYCKPDQSCCDFCCGN